MPLTEPHTNVYDQTEDFWQKYLSGRPRVPDSFFERIFTYHAQHGGSFGTAHDAGAGIGVHSARLVKKFKRVLVTDAAEKNVDLARKRLIGGEDYERCEFKTLKLEQSITLLPSASMEMVFAAVMMHFTDLNEAMAAVAHQLKPGGTFAAAGFGYLILEDEAAQSAWLKVWQKGSERYLKGQSTPLNEYIKQAVQVGASAYDAIPVSEEYFQPGALRIRLNWPGDGCWYKYCVPPGFEDQLPIWSQVGAQDIASKESEAGWDVEMDLAALQRVVQTFPTIDFADEEISKRWRDFQLLVGDRKLKGHWPAFLILAERR